MIGARASVPCLVAGLALSLIPAAAGAVPQPPHDAAAGIDCLDCHAPYASRMDPATTRGGAGAGSSATLLVDPSKTWTPGEWTGAILTFNSGANRGQFRTVAGNTATGLSWARALQAVPSEGDAYVLGRTTEDDVAAKCKTCHNPTGQASEMARVGTHQSADGKTLVGCGECHEPHNLEPNSGAGNHLIRHELHWPGALSPVAYPSGGANPLVADGPRHDGICQACHRATDYFRQDGAGDDTHNRASDCTQCHAHESAFRPACGNCHGLPPTPATEDYAGGGGAHVRHATDLALGCPTCHAGARHNEGGTPVQVANVQVGFGTASYPGGTTLQNGAAPARTGSGATATCTVGCHNPVVGRQADEVPNLQNAVAWSEGPLACVACHDSQGARMGGAPGTSFHPFATGDAAASRADCLGCHDTSRHLGGVVDVRGPDGEALPVTGTDPHELDATCADCHDGRGEPLAGRTPPTVSGFTSGAADFHGNRAGVGWGGTLAPPFARGQGALACRACHDDHASDNPYVLAAIVNGTPLAAGAIGRNGVGAAALCGSCHLGDRHAGCLGGECHGVDPTADPYRPQPSPCFVCHTHNGIANWPDPGSSDGCNHCHSTWFPWQAITDRTAPVITSGPTVALVTAHGATLAWTTSEPASSFVELGLAGSSAPGWSQGDPNLTTSHSLVVTRLPADTAFDFRVLSADGARNEVRSGVGSFTTGGPNELPLAPVPIPQADVFTLTPATVTLAWPAVEDPNGDPVAYRTQVATVADLSSILAEAGWIAARSWTPPELAAGTYWWRVMARDDAHPEGTSPWSAAATFSVVASTRPPSPVLVNQPDFNSGGASTRSITFQWGAVADAEADPVDYLVQVDDLATFASPNYTSGWITATSWTRSVSARRGYFWRVMARDRNHPLAQSAWSATDFFTDTFTKSSCPFVFAWTGDGYAYVTDIQGAVLAPNGPKNVSLFAPQYIVLDDLQPGPDGLMRVKIREPLAEIDYVDLVRLASVDHPIGTAVASSSSENTYGFGYAEPFRAWPVGPAPLAPLSATGRDGSDLLDLLSDLDDRAAPVDPDGLEAYDLQFPSVGASAGARLVIDGWQVFDQMPSPLGLVAPSVDVLDADGAWVHARDFGMPAGDLKTMVVDLTGLLPTHRPRIRVNLGLKGQSRWAIDRIALDVSPVPGLALQESDPVSADLGYGGALTFVHGTLEHRIAAADDLLPDDPASLGTGAFTRYGDVRELLAALDDRFVVMRHGDVTTFAFDPPPVPAGMARTYLLKVDLYYKGSIGAPLTVDPMPFHGMSAYPYPSGESYPADPEHADYLQTWNTRVE